MFSPVLHNVTVMFPSGAGLELRLREGTITTTVLLPEDFQNATLGLLGNMNDDSKDDLVASDGQLVSNQSIPEEVFKFGKSCELRFWQQVKSRTTCSLMLFCFIYILP